MSFPFHSISLNVQFYFIRYDILVAAILTHRVRFFPLELNDLSRNLPIEYLLYMYFYTYACVNVEPPLSPKHCVLTSPYRQARHWMTCML